MTPVVISVLILFLALVMGCQQEEDQPKPPPPPNRLSQSLTPPPPPPPPVTWADFDRAIALNLGGKHDEAGELLARISRLDLSEENRRRVRFLAGIAACLGRRNDRAIELLENLEVLPAALADASYYYLGRAHFQAGHFVQARDLWTEYLKLNPDDPEAFNIRVLRAEALFLSGNKEDGIRECGDLVKKGSGGAALLALARMYKKQGQTDLALETYKAAMEKSNLKAVRAEASEQYRELLTQVAQKPGRDAKRLELVRFMRTEWRLDQVVKLVDTFTAQGGSPNLIDELTAEKAKALFYSGRVQEALPFFTQGPDQSPGLKNPYRALMFARALKRLSRWEEAAAAFKIAAQLYGKSKTANKARYEAGLIYLHLDQKEKADALLDPLGGSYGDDILWHYGLYYFRKKDHATAVLRFQRLISKYKKSKLVLPASYWLARSLLGQGKTKEARALFLQVASNPRDDYYRMLAQQELGRAGRDAAWSEWSDFRSLMNPEGALPETCWIAGGPTRELGDLWTERKKGQALDSITLAIPQINHSLSRFKEALASGVMDMADREAEEMLTYMKKNRLPTVKPAQQLAREERMALVADLGRLETRLFAYRSAYLARIRDYDGFLRLQYPYFKRFFGNLPEEEAALARRRLYPLAYPEPVLAAAGEFKLHPALILSVMRTESNYQDDIMSVANARGLMQILPSTGRKIAARIGEPPPSASDLFKPENNIRYGAWYLSALSREFSGQYPLAIASYNAGPFNVKWWVDQAGDVSLAEFIETIPIDQTRIYVKKILGTYYRYRLLFTGQADGPDLSKKLDKTYTQTIDF